MMLRDALPDDLPAIQAIYAHHVLHGLATFEDIPPDLAEMHHRYTTIRDSGKPYLVGLRDREVVGFCYVSTYRARPAYDYTVEDTIYLAPGAEGRGVGTRLLRELIARCDAGPWRQMIAVISGTGSEASIALHHKLGFTQTGRLPGVGYKHGRWIDTVFMQRALGDGASTPPAASDTSDAAGSARP